MLKASHFGPTVLVTTLALLLSHNFFVWTDSIQIATAIFLGQLSVGWSNDILDVERDRLQNRMSKPLVSGELSLDLLRRALIIDLVFCLIFSVTGPLGIRGGILHIFGVLCGLSYNWYFKFTWGSPVPYVLAFASLAAVTYVATNQTPPSWLVAAGGLFGLAAHFANVLKDMESDREIGIRGLPQIVGVKTSLFIAGAALIVIAVILASQSHHYRWWLGASTGIGLITLIFRPKRYGFQVIMGLAVVDVVTLLFSGVLG